MSEPREQAMSHSAKKIFISYTRSDFQFARTLSRALHRRGLNVWFDAGAVRTGDSIKLELERALQAASWYVVLISDESLVSPWVNFELGAAFGQGKRVLPVFLSKQSQRQAPALLARVQGILAEGLSPEAVAGKVAQVVEWLAP